MNNDTKYLEGELLQIKSDIIFHDLFNEQEMNTLEWTVMQILECSYEDIHGKVRIKNSRLSNINPSERTKNVDLIVEYNDTITIIELNNNYRGNYIRNLLYTFNSISNQFNKSGKNYYIDTSTFKVILVNLNWYNTKAFLKRPHKEKYVLPFPKNNVRENVLEIININLDYYEKIEYNKINKSDKLWKLFTIKNKEELNLFTENEKLLRNYHKKLTILSLDKEYRDKVMWDETIEKNLEEQEAYAVGLERGKEAGIEEGKIENQKEVIINMYQNGISLELISECANLSIDEVKEIINNIK